MFTSGNKARDTTLNDVYYFQPLSTDTGYLADWGTAAVRPWVLTTSAR